MRLKAFAHLCIEGFRGVSHILLLHHLFSQYGDCSEVMSAYYSATDIITYIGVPLAVLGVAPILYNTVTTLATLSKVRRLLRKSRLAGITRGDVVNHVIECELARFSIAPLDREDNSEEYWNVYEHPSLVPGGSWTIFNWKMHAIAIKTQRIEYTDQLRQPQAEIGFEELVSYLLDLGAIPSAVGFQMLRTSGLWVPVGTPLLLSPDRHEAALTVAPLDDSDGMLSLAVRWSRKWKIRDKSSLPPYWIQVRVPEHKPKSEIGEKRMSGEDYESVTLESLGDQKVAKVGSVTDDVAERQDITDTKISESVSGNLSLENLKGLDSTKTWIQSNFNGKRIRCHIITTGIAFALMESPSGLEPLPISHLLPNSSDASGAGTYFSSLCTALSSSNHTVLWSYHIPPAILAFSRTPLIPCGILVLLGIVPISSTPEWYTQYDDSSVQSDLNFKRMRENMAATQLEAAMTPAQRSIASRARLMRQHQDFVDDMKNKQRLEAQRAETRMVEALQSPQWKAKLVGNHTLSWLKEHKHVDERSSLSDVAETLLFKMLIEPSFAVELAEILSAWKGWTEEAGIRKADYLMLKEKLVVFAFASLVLAIICESVAAAHGSLAMDLQESIAVWKRVRLG